MPVEGEAVYEGFADILYDEYGLGEIKSGAFADLRLEVDFRPVNGVVGGHLDNFRTKGVPTPIPGKIELELTRLGNSHSGFFEGNLTGTLDGRRYSGIYGGQFFGNNESDGKPGSVAGTLGGINNEGNSTIIGVWMGNKQSETGGATPKKEPEKRAAQEVPAAPAAEKRAEEEKIPAE